MRAGAGVALVFVAIVGGVAAWRLWPAPPVPAPAASPAAEAARPPPPASAPEAALAVQEPPPVSPSEALAEADVPAAIESLVGRPAVASFRLDDFPHRVAATVDNLSRERATASLWPVVATPGRFLVRTSGGATVVDPDNGQRYVPFVLLVERLDPRQVAEVYRRLRPLLQASYEGLGYPGRSFHARLVGVIDHLLAAPEPTGPLAVHLPPIGGDVQPARPWLLYEFDDPALESLSAGQKLMVRVGPVNERRLKARLRALRTAIVAP